MMDSASSFSLLTATPKLAVFLPTLVKSKSWILALKCSAKEIASFLLVCVHTTINSSPPHLPIKSVSLALSFKIVANSFKIESPTRCPCVSFTSLKWSISIKITLKGSLFLHAISIISSILTLL